MNDVDVVSASVPPNSKNLRACLLCSLIKTLDQFVRTGCENCEEILQLQGSDDRVMDCTSPVFDGIIAMMKPRESWVAKWQRIEKFQRGAYAVQVIGRLPDYIVDELDERGIKYRPRDGT